MLTKTFIVFVWLLFLGLVVYITWNWKKEISNNAMIHIRKTWFGIYILGALIYWTTDPVSIFESWTNYLIIAIVFFAVDAFIFLGLYLKKAGDYELDTLPKDLTKLSDKLTDYRQKVTSIHEILLGEAIIGYYTNEESYFENLKKAIQLYASSEKLTLEFLYYSSLEDREIVEKRYSKYNFLEIDTHLQAKETYYSKDTKLVLFPVEFQDKLLIIEIRSVKAVNEVDVLLIDVLLNMYALGTELDEGGEQNE